MSDLTSQVLAQTLTKTAALRALSEWEEKVRQRVFTDSSQIITDPILKDLTKDNYEEAFTKARQEIEAIEPLYLYLPYELPEEEMGKILAKLRGGFGREFLLEVKLDGNLIGGCALSYEGIYKDYSLKAKLEASREFLKKQLSL